MERRESDSAAIHRWYAVTLLVGMYWSISLLSESCNPLFICSAPPAVCVLAAVHLVGSVGTRVVYETLNLFAMFGIGVGIGGGLQMIGVVEFFLDRLRLFQG